MRLPFGLDFVSILVGVAFAYWVLPMLFGMLNRRKTAAE